RRQTSRSMAAAPIHHQGCANLAPQRRGGQSHRGVWRTIIKDVQGTLRGAWQTLRTRWALALCLLGALSVVAVFGFQNDAALLPLVSGPQTQTRYRLARALSNYGDYPYFVLLPSFALILLAHWLRRDVLRLGGIALLLSA